MCPKPMGRGVAGVETRAPVNCFCQSSQVSAGAKTSSSAALTYQPFRFLDFQTQTGTSYTPDSQAFRLGLSYTTSFPETRDKVGSKTVNMRRDEGTSVSGRLDSMFVWNLEC